MPLARRQLLPFRVNGKHPFPSFAPVKAGELIRPGRSPIAQALAGLRDVAKAVLFLRELAPAFNIGDQLFARLDAVITGWIGCTRHRHRKFVERAAGIEPATLCA